VLGHSDLSPHYAAGHIMSGRLEPGEVRVGGGELSVISDRLSVIGEQLSVVSDRLSVARQAEGDLRVIESQEALVDEVLTDKLIDELRVQDDEEDLLSTLTGQQQAEQQEQDTLFTELGQM
jgi:hypothetical protein